MVQKNFSEMIAFMTLVVLNFNMNPIKKIKEVQSSFMLLKKI